MTKFCTMGSWRHRGTVTSSVTSLDGGLGDSSSGGIRWIDSATLRHRGEKPVPAPDRYSLRVWIWMQNERRGGREGRPVVTLTEVIIGQELFDRAGSFTLCKIRTVWTALKFINSDPKKNETFSYTLHKATQSVLNNRQHLINELMLMLLK